jgi:Domain of unknown function (DUF5916)/Carbohydrate family 9 binding domain-like
MRIRKRLLLASVICVLCPAAPSFAAPENGKTLALVKVESPVVVDGAIDAVWSRADSADDFVQFEPYHGKDPSVRTVAKLLTTDRALYCIMLCYDERKNIQRTKGMLDEAGGDIVSLMIDTFDDKRTAYKFAVTASGARADCRLLDDSRNRDYAWDGVWFSAARIYDWGFVVEMEIPYRSIQYADGLSSWGLDFDRWNPARTEDIYWNAYEENEGQRISKFGRLAFGDFYPSVRGLNLEIYPVGIAKAEYVGDSEDSEYDLSPNAGVDVFYNPSQRLTFQLTANPDFAQIEADPFDFNISRYESRFEERRPFFTEGSEVFTPSGEEQGSGFYQPLELFYSRRIGKKLPDGSEVPLLLGTRAFGRLGGYEYGGFVAATDETDYMVDGRNLTEAAALFGSARLKRQLFENSSAGLLYVGKFDERENTGVVDLDGAFRGADWQLSYQFARSYRGSNGDFAHSSSLKIIKPKWIIAVRDKYIGDGFDVSQVGFVPWQGTAEFTAIGGPRWYFEKGAVQEVLLYTGGSTYWEKVDDYVDLTGTVGINMQFRRNWGYELSFSGGRSKDAGVEYDAWETDLSGWIGISPKWEAQFFGAFSRTYNFPREYLAYFSAAEGEIEWRALDELEIGTSIGAFVEWNPDDRIEDVTFNSRPYVTLTPVNNLSVRAYLDNVYVRSTGDVQQLIGGLLFSYNFSPKSWIYFAVNEIRDRSDEYGPGGTLLPNTLHLAERAAVLKLKYLFYF